ncbi:MAG: hypothetical protein A2186_01840 [Candidatus Levybacteria bacterium RIFOXYA1_FULL_41_10]|uniref:Transmembrane protein n=1 Tax=Candidatus Gottesmanbacteria bacterium GW2011_GWB1_44_11c TaxID=1618447 RepID=A0A0G1GU04_9BACT|nr:MAG: hypothetical protein UT44_C0013G0011 [Candidatus Levybacteria bacterium GW2011_GWA1_39_32]KKR50486.1 MAG: hypothetical protein UT87_C0016G0009 [Candidatus Levybacteria bacterium GW2011_GWC1_40_19]KKR95178.1 MAG: hypothetical protein UU45_C0004G0081 [Candidatus Levybacteria bacterium GW2011_GWA2_41_15]KKT37718.1 MAG: hypothetical protein UW22_C0019G0009 [Candidatus Gottesmanbacteria bacterium GW2011_GWB1_44_11c]OGH21199.1 MAG: hypothetical protein A2695_03640 [Candidatus Levybacteria bac
MEKLALTVAGETIENPVSALPGEGIPALSVILQVGIGLLFIIAILASLVFIIWGGLDWITAGGNKENIQKARHKLIYAVLGFFVVFLAFFIMNIISQFFGIEFFKVPLNPNASSNPCKQAGGTCRFGGCSLNEDPISIECTSGSSEEKCCMER